jgi:hypothetical protein
VESGRVRVESGRVGGRRGVEWSGGGVGRMEKREEREGEGQTNLQIFNLYGHLYGPSLHPLDIAIIAI